MEFDRSHELDDHPDMMSFAPEQGDDVQTVEMMSDIARLDTLAASGDMSTDDLEVYVDMLSHKWRRYEGLSVIVTGAYSCEYEGKFVHIDDGTRSAATFRGFYKELIADDDKVRWGVGYQFTGLDGTGMFRAKSDVHLEFPDVISHDRLELLAAPLLEAIDEVMDDERAESIVFVLNALRDVSLYRNVSANDFNFLYSNIAGYLNRVSGLSDVTALTANLKGDTYDSKSLETVSAEGMATLVDASFYIVEPVPGVPELGLRATMVQRGNRPLVAERVIPLDSMRDIREIG